MNGNTIRLYCYYDRFPFPIVTMIKRVRDTFFQCLIRISIEFPAAIVILRFDDTLHHEHTLQVFQGAVYNLRNRTCDDCCIGIELGNAQNGTVDLGRFSLDNMESVTLYNGQK